MSKQTKNQKGNYFKHFRIYFKSNHPAYIIDEDGNKYIFHRVTSSEKSGHKKNWKIDPNPDKSRNTSMYIVKQEEKDDKKYFSSKLKYNVNLDFIRRKKK